MTSLRRRMTDDMILRNRTTKTIKAYTGWVADFAQYFHTSPDRLGPEHVRSYLLQERQASWNVYRQARLALRFFYTVTLGREWVYSPTVSVAIGTPAPVAQAEPVERLGVHRLGHLADVILERLALPVGFAIGHGGRGGHGTDAPV